MNDIDQFIRDVTKVGSLPKSEVRRRLEAIIEKTQSETAKAYGSCENCYGKGYATQIESTTAFADFGDEFNGLPFVRSAQLHLLYCKCERGNALKHSHQRIELRGRIDEVSNIPENFYQVWYTEEHPFGVNVSPQERIATLTKQLEEIE